MRRRSRLSRGVLIAAGPVVLVAAGIAGYLGFGYTLWAAVAMTLLTLTTVGVRGHALPTSVLVFTAVLAVLGVSVFVVILGLAAPAIVEGRVSVLSRSRRMRQRVSNLSGHYIVCAYGRVGRAIARELEAEGAPFVVVDSKPVLEPDLERDGVCYLIGDASDEAVLRQAGIGRARGLICAVDSDAENVFITIVARSLHPDLLIVARAAREHSADRLYRAGATHVVSPYVTSGRRMASPAIRPHVVEFFDVARTGQPVLRREELQITAGSALAGRSLRELPGPAVPLLVRHADGQLIANPAPELQLRAGGRARHLREGQRPEPARPRIALPGPPPQHDRRGRNQPEADDERQAPDSLETSVSTTPA
jgi:voltage-gated potassium channel